MEKKNQIGDYFLYTDAWNHSYPNYVTWQSYWVSTYPLVACGMLVAMTSMTFPAIDW